MSSSTISRPPSTAWRNRFLKAYRFAMTEPKGPVYICLDSDVQEAKIDKPMVVPHAQLFRPPAGPGPIPNR